MRLDDPLEMWLLVSGSSAGVEQLRRHAMYYLRQIEPAAGGAAPSEIGEDLTEALRQVQEQYRQVIEAGGPGTTYIQEGLLNFIGAAAQPESIPFWLSLLDYKRPRDRFAKRRRTYVVAALANLAIQRDEAAAYDALQTLTRHADPEIRALAVDYLGRASLEAEREVPPELVAHMQAIATEDTAFGPRYWARMFLRDIDAPVPLDNPSGIYVLKVKFKHDKRTYRSIAARADQTLAEVQAAIQRALKWDNDHLYSFFMNGQVHDDRYAIAHPYLEDVPLYADDVAIGELGLVPKHKFAYFFDYGDSHEFEVEVVDIRPKAEPGAYPRVVDSKGKVGPQYWTEDDEEWDDGDDDEDDPRA